MNSDMLKNKSTCMILYEIDLISLFIWNNQQGRCLLFMKQIIKINLENNVIWLLAFILGPDM